MTAFTTHSLTVRHVTDADRPALAAFCVANPGYDILLTANVPDTDEWVEDFLTDLLPPELRATTTHKLIALEPGRPGTILAIIDVSENMLAPGVGHIGLFQVAQAEHGSGLAHELYSGLERWMADRGMDAFRLGVLVANPRGQAFWKSQSYQVSRHRSLSDGSGHVSVVMMKSRVPTTLAQWHARVPRDHPGAA
jgi:GNAT superfamily N-acetyltransferase